MQICIQFLKIEEFKLYNGIISFYKFYDGTVTQILLYWGNLTLSFQVFVCWVAFSMVAQTLILLDLLASSQISPL